MDITFCSIIVLPMYSVLKWIYMLNFFFELCKSVLYSKCITIQYMVLKTSVLCDAECRTTRIEYAFGSIICLVSELHFFSCHVVFLYLCSRMFKKYDQVI
jgi:hypothetical protein